MKEKIIQKLMDIILYFVIVFAILNVCMYFGLIEQEPVLPEALIITGIWAVWKVIRIFLDRHLAKRIEEEERRS